MKSFFINPRETEQRAKEFLRNGGSFLYIDGKGDEKFNKEISKICGYKKRIKHSKKRKVKKFLMDISYNYSLFKNGNRLILF